MKKIIAYILLLAMCVALFAGCSDQGNTQPTDTEPQATEGKDGLASAKSYLYNMYKDSETVTKTTFARVGVVVIQGAGTYEVTWTVDNDAIKITPNGKMVNIEIPEYPEEEINYTLTATIKSEDGKTETVSFKHSVPAAVGAPAKIEDGTYVILAGNLTMTSLTEDKGYGYPYANEVTVANGTVSGHKIADVLTIKNVEGGVTIQDAYGRYFYLKGTYNSFNVSAEIPAEGGHIFNILKNGDTFLIVNAMNKKTLAYSSTYTSWGCYPELGEDHNSALSIIAAVAPEKDPETPDTPDTPDTPVTPPAADNDAVSTPKAGTAYKLALIHGGKGNTKLYFTGSERSGTPWYMTSTQSESEAMTVYVEEVSGGWRLYFMAGNTKTYLDMHKDDTHYSLRLTTEPTAVYKWDKENKTLVATVEDKDCFIGTSGTYDTFSCNKMEYIATSYVAHLYVAGAAGTPDTPDEPDEPDEPDTPATPEVTVVTDPKEGVAYKLYLYQVAAGKAMYFNGQVANNYYLGSDTDPSNGVDIYVEKVEGGYRMYFMENGTKVYVEVQPSGTHKNAVRTTTPTTVLKWNSEFNTFYATIEVEGESVDVYIGTYGTFTTFSASDTSYLGQSGSYAAQLVIAD